jgi:tRNA-uridine 2-sulfurtransferase
MQARAIALLSGGLDSLLAARMVRDLGVDLQGVVFDSGFFSLEPPGQSRNATGELHPLLAKLAAPMAAAGIPVELVDVSEEFLRMLLQPAHGLGSHFNPCIDCKILFLRRARQLLAERGGDFLVTGEVVGQRPMSQNSQTLRTIERESGCQDILLRPLSAKLLPPTRAEREGLIDRERLYAFSGRTRKPQMELAARFGITGYAQPAGGCILTDEGFERRLRDHLAYAGRQQPPTFAQIARLRLGRHFRLPGGAKVIVGRDARENDYLLRYRENLTVIQTADVPGPVVLVEDTGDPAARPFAFGAAARYAGAAPGETVALEWTVGDQTSREYAAPLTDAELQAVRI